MKIIILFASLLGISQSKSALSLTREQTQCEAERETGRWSFGSAGELYRACLCGRPKCNPDGSYFEQQIDNWGDIICVTPWSGTKKWLLSEKPCDKEVLTDTKCRQEAAKVLEEAEQLAKRNVQRMIRGVKKCENNGLYRKVQHFGLGGPYNNYYRGPYCVDEETGEYIRKADRLEHQEGIMYEC